MLFCQMNRSIFILVSEFVELQVLAHFIAKTVSFVAKSFVFSLLLCYFSLALRLSLCSEYVQLKIK